MDTKLIEFRNDDDSYVSQVETKDLAVLTEIQLMLVGGGSADVVFG